MPNSSDDVKPMPPDHAEECPDCGCMDAEVLDHRQRFGDRVTADHTRERVVSATARYRCRNCGKTWRASRPWTPIEEPAPEKQQKVEQPPEQQGDEASRAELDEYDGRGVVFHVVQCPACRSPNTRITSTRRPVRYHRCGDCGQTFKSVEKTDE